MVAHLVQTGRVALRKESVDRNSVQPRKTEVPGVALRKESVDRNRVKKRLDGFKGRSLSARRAWIEISWLTTLILHYRSLSARRAWIEIGNPQPGGNLGSGSLSARRAWIEIPCTPARCCCCCVALRKESVDRNSSAWPLYLSLPPSLSARRAWIEIHLVAAARSAAARRSPQGERG